MNFYKKLIHVTHYWEVSAIVRSFSEENINLDLKRMSTIERCPLQCPPRGSAVRVLSSFHPFIRKVSVVKRFPLYEMSAIRRFYCINKVLYKQLYTTFEKPVVCKNSAKIRPKTVLIGFNITFSSQLSKIEKKFTRIGKKYYECQCGKSEV